MGLWLKHSVIEENNFMVRRESERADGRLQSSFGKKASR